MLRDSEPTATKPDFPAAAKHATIAALVALGLFVLLIGIRTDQGPTGALVLTTRFGTLAVLVAGIFAGTFLRALLGDQIAVIMTGLVSASRARLAQGAASVAACTDGVFTDFLRARLGNRIADFVGGLVPRPGAWLARGLAPFAAGLFLIFALLVPVLFYGNSYLLDLSILIVTYMMLGFGLNIVVGLAGLLDLGYVAFYAVGAYSYALIAHYFGASFWICLPLAGILAAFAGLLLGFPVLRLRGDYLAIVTLGFGEIIRLILVNWQSFTGGPNGMFAPHPSFFGLPFNTADNGFAKTFGLTYSPMHRAVFVYYLILALALLTSWVTLRLRRLPIGRAWEALREDEIACRALGINTTTTKLTAFSMGAMFGGFAGAFFAARMGFISPESFTFGESAFVLAIVVLGGMGSQLGVAIAATAMLGGFEFFRQFEQYRMLIFGAAMVAVMIYRPRGLISTRTPSVFLHERKPVPASIVREARMETLT